jgi:hypothetical protein
MAKAAKAAKAEKVPAVEKPKQVKVEALRYHTNAGEAYDVGDTYEVDETAVDNLVSQGMAVRVDRAAVAKAATQAVEKPAKPAKAKKVKKAKR